jgi:hypothetical protein
LLGYTILRGRPGVDSLARLDLRTTGRTNLFEGLSDSHCGCMAYNPRYGNRGLDLGVTWLREKKHVMSKVLSAQVTLGNLTDYRHDEETRKNNPTAKFAAEGKH